jgi:hypothetical protein
MPGRVLDADVDSFPIATHLSGVRGRQLVRVKKEENLWK